MAEYIDRDELYEQMHVMGMGFDLIEALEMIENFPAADEAPVVRCKECIYLGHVHDFMNLEIDSFTCVRTNTVVNLDDFCSYGERDDE